MLSAAASLSNETEFKLRSRTTTFLVVPRLLNPRTLRQSGGHYMIMYVIITATRLFTVRLVFPDLAPAVLLISQPNWAFTVNRAVSKPILVCSIAHQDLSNVSARPLRFLTGQHTRSLYR